MKRLDQWPEALNALVQSRQNAPFVWGTHDCCLFACDAVQAITGVDLAENIRGHYSSKVGAARMIKRMGGTVETLAERVCAAFQLPEIPLPKAGRGCLLLLDTPEGPSMGVCIGPVGAFAGPSGLVFRRVGHCRRAWQV